MPPPQVTAQADDFQPSEADRQLLLETLADLFDTNDRAVAYLRQARFPSPLIPTWTVAFQFWSSIFAEIERGAMPRPYRRLLIAALRIYGNNVTLNGIARRYRVTLSADRGPALHLIFRIESEAHRIEIEQWLGEQKLDPQSMWSTATTTSYRIDAATEDVVLKTLEARPDLRWRLVPPGAPDHLIRRLFVEGPDGRNFRVSDVPVQYTIDDLVSAAVGHEETTERSAVGILHITPDGEGRSTKPDNTLYAEGIAEGDQLRVGPGSPADTADEAGIAFRTLKVPFHRVLVFGASPVDRPRVRADQETRAIHQAARLGHLEVEPRLAARAADLAEVRRYRPDILHLACHGDGDHLVFEDNQGDSHPVPAATIAAALRNYVSGGGRLRGIVLGVCDGEVIAPAFAGIAGWIVAHRKRLDDACGVVFTRFFYEELRHTTDFREAAYAAADDATREDLSCGPVLSNLIVLPNGA